jgi:UDP-GlcNAc:undecaprenyl-phosphate GlcNAc-1-phosphate transferase
MKGLSEVLRPAPHEAARVLIYGAGDAGVTLLQELRNNRALGRVVVGFMDDDPSKARTRIQGLPVLGGAGMLREALRRRSITEVIVATSKLPASRVEEIVGVCESVGVLLSRFRVAIHNVPRRGHLHGSGGSVEPARTA